MNRVIALSFVLTLMGASVASGQQTVIDGAPPSTSGFDLAIGYDFVRANAPPADCGCFNMNGGFVAGQANLSPWLGVAGEYSAGHASDISSLGQDLTLSTFMAGPRISWNHFRYVPFGEFLVGGAHGGDSYFPSSLSSATSANTFAYATGGGLDMNLNQRFAVRIFDARFLHTSLPNGVTGIQRQLQIEAGMVLRFGGSRPAPHMYKSAIAKEPKRITLQCSTTNQLVAAGQPVHISAEPSVDPDVFAVSYDWTTSGGLVRGFGNAITVDTAKLQPGTYEVDGHVFLNSDPSSASSCKVTFQVTRASEAEDQMMMTKLAAPPGEGGSDRGVRDHLEDLFFNYDQSDFRPDAANALVDDATYLIAHPEIKLTIAGYADERGSAEYNIALGMQRAVATRDALVAGGVSLDRIQVISYGKERTFCSDDTETCYQLNRRAQLVPERQ
jgi:outer membrane protein OmpA-like peptidoglycan-associated protein